MFRLIKISRLNLIRVRRKVSDFLSGLHRARVGKQFATSHLFLTQRENYIRVACSAIIILATNPVLLGNIHWGYPFRIFFLLNIACILGLTKRSLLFFSWKWLIKIMYLNIFQKTFVRLFTYKSFIWPIKVLCRMPPSISICLKSKIWLSATHQIIT